MKFVYLLVLLNRKVCFHDLAHVEEVMLPFLCPQVGKLYIHYQLQVGNGEVVEMQDIPCLLRDDKLLYIQKDYILDMHEICRLELHWFEWRENVCIEMKYVLCVRV